MKPISEELRNRLRIEELGPELVLDLLNETDPEEYCVGSFYKGGKSNPNQCCILGRIGFETYKDPFFNFRAEEFRCITLPLDDQIYLDLTEINNGGNSKYNT